jgi:hypothetical protein
MLDTALSGGCLRLGCTLISPPWIHKFAPFFAKTEVDECNGDLSPTSVFDAPFRVWQQANLA